MPHLYLHVPYCQAKCPYCDFNSIAGREREFAAYVDALVREVRCLPTGPYQTVYLGGGTPTILPARLLARLLSQVRGHIQLAADYEWTVEANPGSAEAERFAVLAEHGVNRVSIGVQSTHDRHLRFLGRVHSAAEAEQVLALARRHFQRVNADLIFGLPDQTDAELEQDLELYPRHGLDHGSCYHLAIEPGTAFAARRQREVDPETSERQFDLVGRRMTDRGLPRYETSNYASEQQRSRHNLAYWHGSDYQAAGAGAVSCVDGIRATRERHPGRYIQAIESGGDAICDCELITPELRLREYWMLGLRLEEGVTVQRLAQLGDRQERFHDELVRCQEQGLVLVDQDRIRLTTSGRLLQDHVTARLMV